MIENMKILDWLLECDEPWTRYRTRLDLIGESENSLAVVREKQAMLDHSQVQGLIDDVIHWGEFSLTRHNDSSHPLHKLALLAEFGLKWDDGNLKEVCEKIFDHQAEEGFFQTFVNSPRVFGGTGLDSWTWILCDAPLLTYFLISVGYESDDRVLRSLKQLAGLTDEVGYPCTADPGFGKFRGPGKKGDPCPIANLFALRAFSLVQAHQWMPAAVKAAEMLLNHWTAQARKKYYLFGVGTDFQKLKAPLVWYDLLNVCDVLSRFAPLHTDQRLLDMVQVLINQADENGRYTAASMYKAWNGWSFADKKQPSPWITFLALRIQNRMQI